MRRSVLYFLLLILRVFFNVISDIVYKSNKLSKAFLEKNFEFVLYEGNNLVMLNLSFVLLLAEINSFLEI